MTPYEIRIGLRYLGSKEKAGFLSVLAWVALSGILVGVMALVVALSFASGFESALRDKIIGINAHLLLLRMDGPVTEVQRVQDSLQTIRDVAAVMPFTYHQALLHSAEASTGTVIRGVPPEGLAEISGWNLFFQCGSLESLSLCPEKEGHGEDLPLPILLGKAQAETLQVDCGDPVDLVSASGRAEGEASGAALRTFRVAGIFEVGMYEYDASLAFLPLAEAQDFFGMGDAVTGLEIRVTDLEKTDIVREQVQGVLDYPFWVKTWREINPNFFSALKLQKMVMFLVLILIILVAGFNIVSTLIMTAIEKRREVAILKAMGATRRSVGKIFLMQGFIMGLLGTCLGLAGGYAVCLMAARYPLIRLDPDIYYLSSLPVEVRWAEFLLVGLSALVLCTLATLYPASRASRLDPAEVLRYE